MPFSQRGSDSKVNFFFGNRAYPTNPLLSNISKFSFRAEESSRFPISFYEQLDSESHNSSLSYKEPPSFPGEALHHWAGRGMPGHSLLLQTFLRVKEPVQNIPPPRQNGFLGRSSSEAHNQKTLESKVQKWR